MTIRPADVIERKRNGDELPAGDIRELVLGYGRGEIPDYQLAAFCMAVWFRGLSAPETLAMTEAIIESGESISPARSAGRSSTSTRRAASGTRRRSRSLRSWPPAASHSGR